MDRNLRIRMLLEAADRVTRPLRDIAGASGKTGRELASTRDKLRQLNDQSRNVSGFRQFKQELVETRTELAAARERATALGRQMASTSTPTRALARDFERARREVGQLEDRQRDQVRSLGDMRRQLDAAGVSTRNLADNERRLRRDIAQTTDAIQDQTRRAEQAADRQRRMGAARTSFQRVQGASTNLAVGGTASIATGMATARPVLGAVGDAQAYESVMTDIAQKADLSRAAAREMGRELLTAARNANQLPESLQQGVDTLSGFGLDPRTAVQMMTPIGKAATAYKAEIGDLSAAAFAAHDNLKVPVAETERMIDIMAQAGKSGAFEVKDMASHFPALTAAYQGLGQSGVAAGADLASALQITRKGAGDSASAATNLGNILQKITAPATVRAFEKMGVDLPAALKRMYAEGKTPIEAIAELTNKTLGGDLSRLGYLFEDAQVQQGLRPLIQNMEEYRRIRESAMSASGTTDADFAERMKDSAEQSQRWEIASQQLGVTLGTTLLPHVNAIAERAANLANRFSDWAERNPALAGGLMKVAAGAAALFLLLGAGAIAVAGILAPFAGLAFVAKALDIKFLSSMRGIARAVFLPIRYLPMLGKGVMGLAMTVGRAGMLLLANPVVLAIVALVAALAFAGYMIWKHWDTIKAAFSGALAFLAGLAARFRAFGANLIQGLINGITGRLAQLKNTVTGAAASAAKWFKDKLGIRSPSRVFMGFGGFMMQGLANGIAQGERGPLSRIDSLSATLRRSIATGLAIPGLAAGPAMASGGAGTGPAAAPAPIGDVHIHINGANRDALDIAAEVERVLRKLQAGDRSAGRASFADRPDWED